jgi:hypothetical protein
MSISTLGFLAQGPFAPPAGEIGTTAIHKDSSAFVAWATHCQVVRGYQDIQQPHLGLASTGEPEFAVGKAGTQPTVSLGDGGSATLTFSQPIVNGEGWDFAVFENAFLNTFLELAFVEVSSDGTNFFRFPATSLTPNEVQVGSFGEVDATHINNLAGKYQANYGTPFDLAELEGIAGLDINGITHIKIIDVVGSINPLYASYDAQGNIINDPYPTAFAQGGFDLDAIGVIHQQPLNVAENKLSFVTAYPNPVSEWLTVENGTNEWIAIQLFTNQGQLVFERSSNTTVKIDCSALPSGIYFLKMSNQTASDVTKIIRL